jgi:hypothetical protein
MHSLKRHVVLGTPLAAILIPLAFSACAPRPPIDPDRNMTEVGVRERHGEQQIHRLLRDRTRIYRDPSLVTKYFERMHDRLTPAPIEGELVLGQVRDSLDEWDRFFAGTK